MPGRDAVIEAIRGGWSVETCAQPDAWTVDDPAVGQCEVSSFVAWEYLGGDLVLAEVWLDGEQQEHHYWNRIDHEDVDLTSEQFSGDEEIREVAVLDGDFLRENQDRMNADIANRIELLRTLVRARIGPPS